MARRLSVLSDRLARIERFTCCVLIAGIVGLILLNVVTRAFNVALFWVDELAVYCMIWMALVGASALLRERSHVSVTLVTGLLSDNSRRFVAAAVDFLILLFAAGLFLMCLKWYDPIGLIRYGFDVEEFAAGTYNFIYQEPTNTLGIQKFWLWLVVPVVSLNMTLHALANLFENSGQGGND